MSIGSIFSSGVQGLHSGINRTAMAGASLNVERDDFAARMVGMRQGEIEAKAAANIIKTGDAILGTLIDIRG